MTLQVNVTAEDIKNGVRQDCAQCPVALAMLRALGESKVPPCDIRVHASTTLFKLKGDHQRMTITNPEIVEDFMSAFDWPHVSNKPAQPFEFTVEVESHTKGVPMNELRAIEVINDSTDPERIERIMRMANSHPGDWRIFRGPEDGDYGTVKGIEGKAFAVYEDRVEIWDWFDWCGSRRLTSNANL